MNNNVNVSITNTGTSVGNAYIYNDDAGIELDSSGQVPLNTTLSIRIENDDKNKAIKNIKVNNVSILNSYPQYSRENYFKSSNDIILSIYKIKEDLSLEVEWQTIENIITWKCNGEGTIEVYPYDSDNDDLGDLYIQGDTLKSNFLGIIPDPLSITEDKISVYNYYLVHSPNEGDLSEWGNAVVELQYPKRPAHVVVAFGDPKEDIVLTCNNTDYGNLQYEKINQDKVKLTATPNNGYKFVKWYVVRKNETEIDTFYNSEEEVFIYDDKTLYAYAEFELLKTYNVTITSSNSNLGTISGGKNQAFEGEEIRLTAIPKDGCEFIHWIVNDVITSQESDITITINDNCNVVAVFKQVAVNEIDKIKIGLNKRSLNYIIKNPNICMLPKEFISDILLLDVIDVAQVTNNEYILNNIIEKYSKLYPYESNTCTKCKHCLL